MKMNKIRIMDNHQAEIAKILKTLAYRHSLWNAFRDFVMFSACAISNAVDKKYFDVREAQYMESIKKYSKDETILFAKALSHVTAALEGGHQDFLGSLFMSLELGDTWKGQFFTPYSLSLLMAKMTQGDEVEEKIVEQGFISYNDPCVGAGAMIIAAAHALQDKKINYQKHMHAVATDIDIVAVHMSYIQFSLLHIPAVVVHGNSLSMEVWSEWRTPAHMWDMWDVKLKVDRAGGVLFNYAKPEISDVVETVETQTISQAEPEIFIPAKAINIRDQMSLF